MAKIKTRAMTVYMWDATSPVLQNNKGKAIKRPFQVRFNAALQGKNFTSKY